MSSHYNFAEIATRIIAVAFDTTGKAWIVQREFINSAWRTTLESHFTPVNQVEFTATIPAGHAGFGTVQMSGWPYTTLTAVRGFFPNRFFYQEPVYGISQGHFLRTVVFFTLPATAVMHYVNTICLRVT